MKRIFILIAALALVTAACSESAADETTAPTTEPTTAATTADEPPVAPSEIVFDAQNSDGTSIVVASVTLPAPGFIAVHANADGTFGPVIGNSELLPEGTSTDVTVTLDEPLTETDLLWPMVHIDMDDDGVYTFAPPDNAIDIPGMTADGDVAVVSAEVTVDG